MSPSSNPSVLAKQEADEQFQQWRAEHHIVDPKEHASFAALPVGFPRPYQDGGLPSGWRWMCTLADGLTHVAQSPGGSWFAVEEATSWKPQVGFRVRRLISSTVLSGVGKYFRGRHEDYPLSGLGGFVLLLAQCPRTGDAEEEAEEVLAALSGRLFLPLSCHTEAIICQPVLESMPQPGPQPVPQS